jgi:hypothetical protein
VLTSVIDHLARTAATGAQMAEIESDDDEALGCEPLLERAQSSMVRLKPLAITTQGRVRPGSVRGFQIRQAQWVSAQRKLVSETIIA